MIKRLFLLHALIICVGCASMRAQQVREVDGEKFITHTVLKGQTLFAISKHYAVPLEAITKANPAAGQGLSVGQVLLIPVKAQVKKDLKNAPALAEGELAHTVKKKETLYGIAKQYGLDQNELVTRNPELATGVREGMIITIPVSRVANVPASAIAPAYDDQSISHLLQPGETVFSLAKQYGVTSDAILLANGGLPGGAKAGTYLRIPPKPAEPAPVKEPAHPLEPGTEHKVAFLLPFSIAANDSLQTRVRDEKGMYSVTSAAVQFYAGAQMAMDSLRTKGFTANVRVFDVGEDAGVWGPVLKDNALRDMELCIGPFHRAAIEGLARVAPNAHIVCPVQQSNKVLLGNPRVSKVLSGKPDQLQYMARYVAYHHSHDNIILARPAIPAEKEQQDQMLRMLQDAMLPRTDKLRDSVLVAVPAKRDVGEIIKRLNASQMNVVVAPSEDLEFVTTLVAKLAEQVPKYRVTLFGMPGWTNLENVEFKDLSALNTHVPATSFIDYDDARVRTFIQHYRDRFTNEPGEYAFLGFDITFYYFSALMQGGTDFTERFAATHTDPLHLTFKLYRTGEENGFRNESAVMLEYKDMGLHKAP